MCRCVVKHPITLQEIYWCGEQLIVISSDGNLYKGTIAKDTAYRANRSATSLNEEFVEQKSSRRSDVCENSKYLISLMRVPNADRVTDISFDQRGESFVILQESSKRYLITPQLSDEPISLKTLLNQSTEVDGIHDIVFHVGHFSILMTFYYV